MDLNQLRYFSAVVDHGSFRKAADALHVSPPALSLSIKDAIESGQLAELHVPKIEWSSTVALVSRAGEGLSPDAGLLRDETRAAMCEIGA